MRGWRYKLIYTHQGHTQDFRLVFVGGGALEQARSPESESKSEGEKLDLQANPICLNDCESD
jgi:hypothetical protein